MTNIDQFESVFKAADKPRLEVSPVVLERVLVVSDLDPTQADGYLEQLKAFLADLPIENELEWQLLGGEDFHDARELVAKVKESHAQMICTHRGLKSDSADYPYSLGGPIEVLTQATSIPVLLTPDPRNGKSPLKNEIAKAMAITDHLAGDHQLVSHAAWMVKPGGTLFLAHVEDEVHLERFLAAIAKIPYIDTDVARETIIKQLLQDPHDYIASCREVLNQHGLNINVEEIVTVGHRLRDYEMIVKQRHVDLAVMNTKDDDQLAIHGLAYPLTVELAQTPLLLL